MTHIRDYGPNRGSSGETATASPEFPPGAQTTHRHLKAPAFRNLIADKGIAT